jgi:hypothetical protein
MRWQQHICKGRSGTLLASLTRLVPPPASQVLFCRYNDPSYVKLEKLEIMVKLASAQNIDQARAVCTAPQSLPGLSLTRVCHRQPQQLSQLFANVHGLCRCSWS